MNIVSKLFGGIISSIFIGAGSIASAEVTADDANKILKLMQSFGLIATMGIDSDGDPRISSRVGDSEFLVYFYGCTNNENCKSILFKAGYNLKTGISAGKVNEWNRNKRFGKAYIDDDGDPFLEMDVNLDFGGVDDKNFDDTLDWWRITVVAFEEFINW